jgi:hypothetical protein
MSRRWSDTDANGHKLTDGRVCLVIESDDPNLPPIYTYGKDKDEVLEKLAHTTETAQATIQRLRSAPKTPATPRRGITADERARATVDLANPAKSGEALKTLLRGEGVDVDAQRFNEETKRMSSVALEWERAHPAKIWKDPRNQRLLIDAAILRCRFRETLAPESLDAAYEYLLEHQMLFEVPDEPATPVVHPDGSPDSRTPVRMATTYRGTALRGTAPAVVKPKPKYTRAEIDAMNTKVYRDKLENEPGFAELVNEYHATPVKRSA